MSSDGASQTLDVASSERAATLLRAPGQSLLARSSLRSARPIIIIIIISRPAKEGRHGPRVVGACVQAARVRNTGSFTAGGSVLKEARGDREARLLNMFQRGSALSSCRPRRRMAQARCTRAPQPCCDGCSSTWTTLILLPPLCSSAMPETRFRLHFRRVLDRSLAAPRPTVLWL